MFQYQRLDANGNIGRRDVHGHIYIVNGLTHCRRHALKAHITQHSHLPAAAQEITLRHTEGMQNALYVPNTSHRTF